MSRWQLSKWSVQAAGTACAKAQGGAPGSPERLRRVRKVAGYRGVSEAGEVNRAWCLW